MGRRWIVLVTMTSATLGLVACADDGGATTASGSPGSGSTPGIDAGELSGRIAFMRGDPEQEAAVTYTVAPDGSDEQEVFPEGNSASPTWSPDGPRSTSSAAATAWSRTSSIPIRASWFARFRSPTHSWSSSAEVPGRRTATGSRARRSASKIRPSTASTRSAHPMAVACGASRRP